MFLNEWIFRLELNRGIVLHQQYPTLGQSEKSHAQFTNRSGEGDWGKDPMLRVVGENQVHAINFGLKYKKLCPNLDRVQYCKKAILDYFLNFE